MPGKVAAVIVAAGRGYRAGGDMPKQYRELAGEPVIRPTLAAFLDHPQIGAVQPVIHPDDEPIFLSSDCRARASDGAGSGRRHAPGIGPRRA